NPLLVLLDLNMPVMSGFDFLQAYHLLPDTCRRRIKVVVLSSSEQFADVQQAQQLAADFISKPLTEEVLARLLAQHMGYGAPAA
ncbi:MAG: response regulator, partial [Hymenobacter sp.]